jgi:hypothetical protein
VVTPTNPPNKEPAKTESVGTAQMTMSGRAGSVPADANRMHVHAPENTSITGSTAITAESFAVLFHFGHFSTSPIRPESVTGGALQGEY